MSPKIGNLLLNEVAPRIRSSIHSFVPIGSDDREEQCQDAVATAALNPVSTPQIIVQLGAVRLAQQNYAEATTLLREGLRLTEKHDLDTGYRLYVMNLLGASLAGQKNHADAEPLLLQSCQGLQQRQASLALFLNAPRRITESLERLVQLYDAWGPAQAAEWKQKLAAFQQEAKAAEKKGAKP